MHVPKKLKPNAQSIYLYYHPLLLFLYFVVFSEICFRLNFSSRIEAAFFVLPCAPVRSFVPLHFVLNQGNERSVKSGFFWFRALIQRTRNKQKPQPNPVERQQNEEEWTDKKNKNWKQKSYAHSTIIIRYRRRRHHHHRHWSVVKTELKFNILFFGY